jgi:hypothetical protein
MSIITEKMFLRNLEVKDLDTIWNLVNSNIETLPLNWPSKQSKFYDWLYLGILDEFPSKYIVEYHTDNNIEIVGLISIDIITKQNLFQYKNANIDDADITYLTSSQYAGMGLATFAVNEVSRKLIGHNCKPIMRIPTDQKASARIAIKCGFIKIDDEKSFEEYDDGRVSLEIFRKIVA